MNFCPNYTRIAWRLSSPGQVELTRLRCKQWDCEYCAKLNQEMWRTFLRKKLALMYDDWYHLTLTAHSQARTLATSYSNLTHGIDVLMKRARRVFGKIQYVRVFEPHPTGNALHAHLVIAGLSDYVVPGCAKNLQPQYLAISVRGGYRGVWSVRTWFKKSAQECRIGYQAEIKWCQSHIATRYISKYLTKSHQNIPLKGIRRIQTTRAIGSPQKASDERWNVGTLITPGMFANPVEVHDAQTGETISQYGFLEAGYYPID